MGYRTVHDQSQRVWDLARRQHGVVARYQLIALGVHPQAIKHRIATGRLHPIHRGVYAAGRRELTSRGRLMAAVLACGRQAALSHASAGSLWGFLTQPRHGIDVSVPVGRAPRPRNIRVHRRTGLGADLTRRHHIPVTTPVRTLIDLATQVSPSRIERAVNEADRLDLVDPESLRAEIDRREGQRGVPALRKVLDRATFALTDSELERRFLAITRRAGLPPPLTQHLVNGHRVDFFWPALGLVVETDGLRYHRTPTQQMSDRVRDQVHAAAGLTPLRFTHAQVSFGPGSVAEVLRAVAARLSATRH